MPAHLFGAARGAYTGAHADRVGAFEAASGGTLFLDEIGNLSAEAQTLLLSVLQESTVTRLGDTAERQVDVKLVVATNEDLAARVRAGTFRADLFMRLNPAAAVTLPGLQERGLELEGLLRFCLRAALARPYLRELVEAHAAALGVSPELVVQLGDPPGASDAVTLYFPPAALSLLRAHPWPGNLREFALAVENAAWFALAESDDTAVVEVRASFVRELLQATLGAPIPGRGHPVRVTLEAGETLNQVSRSVEKQYFSELYRLFDGDFGRVAAVLLGDPTAARKAQLRFNQLGLKVRDFSGTGS